MGFPSLLQLGFPPWHGEGSFGWRGNGTTWRSPFRHSQTFVCPRQSHVFVQLPRGSTSRTNAPEAHQSSGANLTETCKALASGIEKESKPSYATLSSCVHGSKQFGRQILSAILRVFTHENMPKSFCNLDKSFPEPFRKHVRPESNTISLKEQAVAERLRTSLG